MKNLFFFLFSVMFVGCSRDSAGTGTDAKLVFQFGDPRFEARQKNSAMSIPANAKICYAVNIVGGGLPVQNKKCSPELGAHAGFVEPGQSMELTLPRGSGRRVEVYALVSEDLTKCPSIDGEAEIPTDQVYRVGLVENVNMAGAETNVEVAVTFPASHQHIVNTLNLPQECATSSRATLLPGNSAVVASGRLTSADNKILAFEIKHTPRTVVQDATGRLLYVE